MEYSQNIVFDSRSGERGKTAAARYVAPCARSLGRACPHACTINGTHFVDLLDSSFSRAEAIECLVWQEPYFEVQINVIWLPLRLSASFRKVVKVISRKSRRPFLQVPAVLLEAVRIVALSNQTIESLCLDGLYKRSPIVFVPSALSHFFCSPGGEGRVSLGSERPHYVIVVVAVVVVTRALP